MAKISVSEHNTRLELLNKSKQFYSSLVQLSGNLALNHIAIVMHHH